jgi:hypothetical protein
LNDCIFFSPAGLFFGSNFVPVKTHDAGDGLFFQWVLCSAVFCLGFVVYVARGFPPFSPLAMLGGALWCFGNLMSVPIINMIGLSLGVHSSDNESFFELFIWVFAFLFVVFNPRCFALLNSSC